MKPQRCEPTKVIDLVPQVLHLKKILVPTDFSPASKQAFKYAVKFAEQFDGELTLIHVLTPAPPSAANLAGVPAFSDKELDNAEKNLRDLVTSAREASVTAAQSTFRVGLATHEIVEAAKELNVDLIVIATHGYTGWKHLCIGSTAERVVRAAPCPVFVVREKEHEFI
ncbi:MAG TPA: universal stress protein [Candidatus Udaeobacter sp.]|jgi:nucleotide-binding universal stress UspA family protein|nr:universal stress protein [Candidatus Udaeobacter sp.]